MFPEDPTTDNGGKITPSPHKKHTVPDYRTPSQTTMKFVAAFSALFLSVTASPQEKPDILRRLFVARKETRSLQSFSCVSAYSELHDENPQFGNAAEDIFDAFQACEGFCDVDGRSVLGDGRFEALIERCSDIGGTFYVDTIDVDCEGSEIDHTFTNVPDCLPPECSESDNEALAQNTEESIEQDLAFLSLSCNVEYTSTKSAANARVLNLFSVLASGVAMAALAL